MSKFTIETTPFSADKVDDFQNILQPNTTVYVTFLPGTDYKDTIRIAKRLRREQLNPVPHFAARSIPSYNYLEDSLNQLCGEAGIDEVLCIAGAIEEPIGDFSSSMELIGTNLFNKYNIKRIGVAGHPEGSPDISDQHLDEAIKWKNEFNSITDSQLYIITQFCFDTNIIINWDKKLRSSGNSLPITVGVPGVASLKTLLGYAKACGVGQSIKFLKRQAKNLTQLIGTSAPDEQIIALTEYQNKNCLSGIQGIHIYPLGGLKKSAAWAYEVINGNFKINNQTQKIQIDSG